MIKFNSREIIMKVILDIAIAKDREIVNKMMNAISNDANEDNSISINDMLFDDIEIYHECKELFRYIFIDNKHHYYIILRNKIALNIDDALCYLYDRLFIAENSEER